MIRRLSVAAVCVYLTLTLACSRHSADARVILEIPAGFKGNFVMVMGSRDADPLRKDGDVYIVQVPSSGRLQTSTLLQGPKVTFKNAATGTIWGYSQSTFTTGDGIAVGGKIEFFVGSQQDYEAEQGRKNHSGRAPGGADLNTSGV
jgi:hypothetical protein